VNVLEDLGLSGCHIEDQVNPKRCGHLDGKEIVTAAEMRRRIKAAVGARRDPGFAICARTDARAVEGLSGAIERAKSYLDEGADIVFPDALEGASELEKFKKAVDAPVLANMTEFGKTELLDAGTLASIGVNIVIYPVTLLRLAMGAAERGLRALASEGTQKGLLEQMQTRAQLYELLGYDDYTAFDTSLGEI
jgi:methylisocitrate lyase